VLLRAVLRPRLGGAPSRGVRTTFAPSPRRRGRCSSTDDAAFRAGGTATRRSDRAVVLRL